MQNNVPILECDNDTVQWSELETKKVIVGKYRDCGKAQSSLIAAFDFDYTLVCTKSGKTAVFILPCV